MYDVALESSYFPAQLDLPVLETTVGNVLRQRSAASPAAPALIEIGPGGSHKRRWTYGELLEQSERLARALLSRFEPGQRICVWAPNAPEWVILEYAAAIVGLTLVTANPSFQERELRYVLEQSRARGLFMVREHRGNPMAQIAASAVAGNPSVQFIVDLEDHDALFAGADTVTALPLVSPGDPVQIQYTSGTTGVPKGAVISHRGMTNNARFHFAISKVREGEIVLNFMPLFHTASCGLMVLGSAQFGCCMVLARQYDPPTMLDLVEREQIGMLMGVPTMLVGLLEAQQDRPRRVRSVKQVLTGGAAVPPELIRRVRERFGCDVLTVYGQTENSPLITQVRPGDPHELALSTVGQPFPQTEISIRDPVRNDIVPISSVGEICTRGYAVMIGYNDDPQATAAAIDSDGWLHTGDLGTLDKHGFVTVTGRVKDMIIRGGENLFPAEIEGVILEHDSVAEAAVVGAPDPRWGEIVVAFVRLAAFSAFDQAALIAHCRKRISAHKIPERWIVINQWPLTGPGKIQKFILREQLKGEDQYFTT